MKSAAYGIKVVMEDDEGVVMIGEVSRKPRHKLADISTVLRPDINALAVKDLLEILAQALEESYYMSRVKTLSKEARENIIKALRDQEDLDAAPF